MSQLTECNFCTNKKLVKRALERGLTITYITTDFELGGVDVFMHPEGMKQADVIANREQYFIAWFMRLGDHCEC